MGGDSAVKRSHETYREHSPERKASDRSFGLTFAVVFALAAAYCAYGGWILGTVSFAVASLLIGVVALTRARLLAPANRVWTGFGLLLHKIVNPLIMGFMFYVVFTPMGTVMRLFGFDPLGRKRRGAIDSYWTSRDPAAAERTDMTQQF